MSDFQFPKRSNSQKIGRAGEAFFKYFVNSILGWSYRPVHQEEDFGIDGYIDIVKKEHITGRSLAVQIKCGDSYFKKKCEGGIRYEGEDKHLNYYLNLQVPVVLIVINGDHSQSYWVQFDIEQTTPNSSGWQIMIPEKNILNENVKNAFSQLAGEPKNFSEDIKNLWAMNSLLSNTSSLAFAVSKAEVKKGSLLTPSSMIKKLTSNSELLLCKRASAEIFFPEYSSDDKELYEIPEVRNWFSKSIKQGIPWFYFLNPKTGIGLKLLFFCTCNVLSQGRFQHQHYLSVNPQDQKLWFEHNFVNLNAFTESNGISPKVNKEISDGIFEWFSEIFID